MRYHAVHVEFMQRMVHWEEKYYKLCFCQTGAGQAGRELHARAVYWKYLQNLLTSAVFLQTQSAHPPPQNWVILILWCIFAVYVSIYVSFVKQVSYH